MYSSISASSVCFFDIDTEKKMNVKIPKMLKILRKNHMAVHFVDNLVFLKFIKI